MSELFDTALVTFDLVPESEGWELAVQTGIVAQENADDSYWIIGRLALRVQKRYGEDTIGKFAAAINVPKGSVTEYRGVCDFWPEHIVKHYRSVCPNVPYTIYREATRLKRDGQDECSAVEMTFIEVASAANWSVTDAREAVAALRGKPTPEYKKAGEFFAKATATDTQIIFDHTGNLEDELLEAIQRGEVKVVIYGKREKNQWDEQRAADLLTVDAVRNLAPRLPTVMAGSTAAAEPAATPAEPASQSDKKAPKRKANKPKDKGTNDSAFSLT